MNTEQVIERLQTGISPLRDMESTLNNRAINIAVTALRAQAERENPRALTLEQLKKMDGKRAVAKLDDDVYLPVLVAYHTDSCDDDDGDDVYLTNNLGGRSTYEEAIDMGAVIYAHEPKEGE